MSWNCSWVILKNTDGKSMSNEIIATFDSEGER